MFRNDTNDFKRWVGAIFVFFQECFKKIYRVFLDRVYQICCLRVFKRCYKADLRKNPTMSRILIFKVFFRDISKYLKADPRLFQDIERESYFVQRGLVLLNGVINLWS